MFAISDKEKAELLASLESIHGKINQAKKIVHTSSECKYDESRDEKLLAEMSDNFVEWANEPKDIFERDKN